MTGWEGGRDDLGGGTKGREKEGAQEKTAAAAKAKAKAKAKAAVTVAIATDKNGHRVPSFMS